MKIVKVVCKAIGTAIVTTGEVHSENENKASKIVIDFTELAAAYPDWNKWVDIVVDGEDDIYSMRYDLGTEIVVEKELEYENTIAGHMTITPFLYDGVTKVKLGFKKERFTDIVKEATGTKITGAISTKYSGKLIRDIGRLGNLSDIK